jgi:hypothetical protein
MGLDMLFMVGEKVPFVKRAAGFLGLHTQVFPKVSSFDFQPDMTVGSIISDLYDFRNIVAHGQEIPKVPFREEYWLVSTCSQQINYDRLSYLDVLTDAALFILTTVLKRIFTEGLFEEVVCPVKWRRRLTLYEHRFKNAGGVVSARPSAR